MKKLEWEFVPNLELTKKEKKSILAHVLAIGVKTIFHTHVLCTSLAARCTTSRREDPLVSGPLLLSLMWSWEFGITWQ